MRFAARIAAAAPAALGVALVLAATVQAADKPTPLVMAYVAADSNYWDIDAAIARGFFSDEGFAPEPAIFQSSRQAVQLLISRGADLAAVEPEALMAAVLRGASDLGALGQAQQAPDWLLVARPEIKDWSDLKGKIIGFSALRSLEFFLTKQLLTDRGLGANDWNAIPVGAGSAKRAALEKGSIAASVLFQPSALRALGDKSGLHALARYSDIGHYPPTVFTVRRSWAAADGKGLRLSRALERAHRWLYDSANHDAALTIVEKYTKCDAAMAQTLYDQYFAGELLYTDDDAIDLAGLSRESELLVANGAAPKDRDLNPRQFVIARENGGRWR